MKPLLLLTSLVFLLPSCSRLSEDELFQAAQTAYQQKNVQTAMEKLQELLDRFPRGKHAETSQFLIARICNDDLHDYQKAIAGYRRYREMFGDSARASTALFLIGFIYNNELHQYDSARAVYEEFLARYPDHAMASSAKFELENLGKNPEELFKPQVAAEDHHHHKEARRPAPTGKKKK